MEVYVMPEPPENEELQEALDALVTRYAEYTQNASIKNGPPDSWSPHLDLAQIMGMLVYFRHAQMGFEKVIGEACADDEELSDSWLTISNAGHACDSIIEQMGIVLEHYCGVIAKIQGNPDTVKVIQKTADQLVEEHKKDHPEFKELIEEYQKGGRF